mmetsp:Transcript_34339/g.39121  ORF Transcript_34339/g.39121 Transcript_34339/m.39121 type:complete len:448 (-) Transcript_34339:106-1449(-)
MSLLTGKRKANKELTPEERRKKQYLKRELKAKRKRAKLEARLRHAIFRKDKLVEQETRALLSKEKDLQKDNTKVTVVTTAITLKEVITTSGGEKENNSGEEHAVIARDFILNIYRRLKEQQKVVLRSDDQFSKTTKALQTNNAVKLLRHMAKGTQLKEMFGNRDALWGYTRQKFQERALLVYTSLSKLQQSDGGVNVLESRKARAWNAIKGIKTICSVGCGPGCDAIGVVALLQTLRKNESEFIDDDENIVEKEQQLLDSVFLFDWAMDQWTTIVSLLKSLIVPSLVKEIHCSSCDITKSIIDDICNTDIKKTINHGDEEDFHPRYDNNDDDEVMRRKSVDLYLLSYILTETRDKWHNFWNELVEKAKPNSLFYIAEPTPWQLHKVMQIEEQRITYCYDGGSAEGNRTATASRLEFIWLDSSMDQTENVQALDGRLGPGVLLARKIE